MGNVPTADIYSRNPIFRLGITVLTAALVACGGGGGSGSADTTPTAVNDSVAVARGDRISIDVLSNDDFSGNGPANAAIAITEGPQHGSAEVDEANTPSDPTDDTITYIAPADFTGSDTLRYRIADADGDTAEAVVTVTITTEVHIENALLSTSDKVKTLTFSWASSRSPHHWRLELNPDGVSGYQTATDNIAAATRSTDLEAGLHLLDWTNARYQIVAIGEDGQELGRSEALPVSSVVLSEIVGRIEAPLPEENAYFGTKLALSGDGKTLAVGAPSENGGYPDGDIHEPSAGMVFLYAQENGVWNLQRILKAPVIEAWVNFGETIGLSDDGSVLAVGETGFTLWERTGAVYVYERNGDSWETGDLNPTAVFSAPENETGLGGSGLAISADGNSVAAGAPRFFDAQQGHDGAVYLYQRSANGWEQTHTVYGEGSTAGIGGSLAFSSSGQYLAIKGGAAGVLIRNTDTGEMDLIPPPIADTVGFGYQLALSGSGDIVAVSSPSEDDRVGAVYVFERYGNDWQQQARLKASHASVSNFGTGLSLSADGKVLAASTPWASSPAGYPGQAFIFKSSNAGWAEIVRLSGVDSGPDDAFGYSVALSADGNTMVSPAVGERVDLPADNESEQQESIPNAGVVYIY